MSHEPARPPSTYRVTLALVLRVAGPVAIALGLVWIVVALAGVTGAARGVLAIVTLVVVLALLVAVVRPPRVLSLDERGYAIRWVRGAGVTRAPWREVQTVEVRADPGAASLVFALSGGRHSVLPLALLGSRQLEAQRDVQARLNRAYGYRKL